MNEREGYLNDCYKSLCLVHKELYPSLSFAQMLAIYCSIYGNPGRKSIESFLKQLININDTAEIPQGKNDSEKLEIFYDYFCKLHKENYSYLSFGDIAGYLYGSCMYMPKMTDSEIIAKIKDLMKLEEERSRLRIDIYTIAETIRIRLIIFDDNTASIDFLTELDDDGDWYRFYKKYYTHEEARDDVDRLSNIYKAYGYGKPRVSIEEREGITEYSIKDNQSKKKKKRKH